MILSVTLSKPVKNISEILGENFTRVKIKLAASSFGAKNDELYFCEFYTEKQVFHKKFSEKALDDFLNEHAGTTFKNCVERTESEEITILANKKGKKTELRKKIAGGAGGRNADSALSVSEKKTGVISEKYRGEMSAFGTGTGSNRKKNHILSEGIPVPFLVHLGVQTAEGRVISSKYDKFRQINRFLEFIDDILPDVIKLKENAGDKTPLKIVDFGSGKSYLTFAVQYFLNEIKNIPAEITGLDLKKDVIDYCSQLSEKLSLSGIKFSVGDIASYGESSTPDIVITLHACDTATDYAFDYAVSHNAKAILSVPCCQHEINSQLKQNSVSKDSPFAPLLKFGLIKEKFSALVTDAVRAELLENCGYKVQILEFIDDSATPKNLLIRAVKTESTLQTHLPESVLLQALGARQTLDDLQRRSK